MAVGDQMMRVHFVDRTQTALGAICLLDTEVTPYFFSTFAPRRDVDDPRLTLQAVPDE
jgi:hypothetical protein